MTAVIDPKLIINSISVVTPFLDPSSGGRYKVKALCESLTLTRKDIATMTGKTPSWFQDYWSDKFVKPNDDVVRENIEQLLLIFVLLDNLFKDEAQGRLWLRLPNPAFENRTPASLMVDGKLATVRDSLISIVSGGIPA